MTRSLLLNGSRVAGGAFATDHVACGVDFVEADRGIIRIYSVAPKAVDLERHSHGLEFTSTSGAIRQEWREHLTRTALRWWVVQNNHPQHRVIPLLVAPVCGAVARIEGLHRFFEYSEVGWRVSHPDAIAEAANLLRRISVAAEIRPLLAEIPRNVAAMARFLEEPRDPVLSYTCRRCEFRVDGDAGDNGFARCFAGVKPSLFELTYLYAIKDDDGQPIANRLLRDGRMSISDIPEDRIVGPYARRQRMQLHATATGREIIQPELREVLANIQYPIHFFDLESARSLCPIHAGLKVNGLVLFQFSVHTLVTPCGELTHTAWLNVERSNPNRRFLSALRAALGNEGSVAVWTRYEEECFNELLCELISANVDGDDVRWLKQFLNSKRLVDLHAICCEHYYAPQMRGSFSIKAVLPATWKSGGPWKSIPPFNGYSSATDPYAQLKADHRICDGCLAMNGYLDVQGTDIVRAKTARDQLDAYCFVDTMAMAAVWKLWSHRIPNTYIQWIKEEGWPE